VVNENGSLELRLYFLAVADDRTHFFYLGGKEIYWVRPSVVVGAILFYTVSIRMWAFYLHTVSHSCLGRFCFYSGRFCHCFIGRLTLCIGIFFLAVGV
jgi:hypothetical protein